MYILGCKTQRFSRVKLSSFIVGASLAFSLRHRLHRHNPRDEPHDAKPKLRVFIFPAGPLAYTFFFLPFYLSVLPIEKNEHFTRPEA